MHDRFNFFAPARGDRNARRREELDIAAEPKLQHFVGPGRVLREAQSDQLSILPDGCWIQPPFVRFTARVSALERELRFFGGLTEKEAAEVLGVSVSTLKRDWEFARTWLAKELAHTS